ncbi:hypothetical protein ACEU6E_08985 [Halorutilales archaeon Cl-col2-1]
MINEITYITTSLVITVGIVGMYKGWKRRGIYRYMESVRTVDVGVVDPPETVEVEGTAVESDCSETIRAPVTEREALATAWKIEEWDERGDRSTWREVARGIEVAEFVIEDDTGEITVESISRTDTAGKWTQTTGISANQGIRMDDALIEFRSFPKEYELDPSEETPTNIRELHEKHGLYEDTDTPLNAVDIGTKHGTRRYMEGVIEPGEAVYALGCADTKGSARMEDDREGTTTKLTECGGDLFILSNHGEEEIEKKFKSSYKSLFYPGLVGVIIGVGILLYKLGIWSYI